MKIYKQFIIPEQKYASRNREHYIKIHYSEFYQYLMDEFPNDISFVEKLYWYRHNIYDYPSCPVCGKKVKFLNTTHGYYKYCSLKCSNISNDVIKKKKQTKLERYGDENYINLEKIKQTNLEKYGAECSLQNKEIRDKGKQTKLERYGDENYSNHEKAKQTLLKHYGVEYTFKSEEIKNKAKQTLLNRYGVEYAQQNKEIVKKSKQTFKQNIVSKYDNIIDANYGDVYTYTCCCHHPDCNKCIEKQFVIDANLYWTRKTQNVELCTKLLPQQESYSKGTTLELFARMILDEYNIEYVENDKNILSDHKELDIYIPSKNIAIECNGLYWHFQKDKDYHKNKFVECSQKGIQLITLWEDWIRLKPDILKSLLLSKLNIYQRKIYARNCEVREIDSKISSYFLKQNHIQGNTSSKVKYGLFYNNELVSVMTFGHPKYCSGDKKQKHDEWELSRFCTLQNTQVIGAAGKLLKHFIICFKPKNIISFASNDVSVGNLYKSLGFEKTRINNSYWYIDEKILKRYHRSSFTKMKLIERGENPNLTEDQIMRKNKFYKIYDCGQTKYILNL